MSTSSTTTPNVYQITCGRSDSCGFRVDTGYYVRKPRFSPGDCANCGGPLKFIDETGSRVPGARMLLVTDGGLPAGTVVVD